MSHSIELTVAADKCLVIQGTVTVYDFIFESEYLHPYNGFEVNVVSSIQCNQVAVFDGPNFVCSAHKLDEINPFLSFARVGKQFFEAMEAVRL